MEPLTISEMKAKGLNRCADPKCNQEHNEILFLTQKCHPDVPTETFVDFRNNTVVVQCALCQRPIAILRIVEHARMQ